MDKLLLKPDRMEGFTGWKRVKTYGVAKTNAGARDYGYLLSLLGIK